MAHLADAWRLLQDNNGSQYAGAITYFSFLALFPLLLLAVAIAGYVLHAHPAALQSLLDHITEKVPGDLGNTLRTSVTTAIRARTGVGLVGLAGVLLTGLGWVANVRAAIDAVWGLRPAKRPFLAARLANLVVLVGLGVGTLVSLGVTVAGTSVTDQLVRAAGWEHVSGLPYLLKASGLVVGLAADVLIFWWLLVRLPAVTVPRRVGVKGAVLAAVGFQVLKVAGTYTIAHTANSPTAGPFAGLLAVLIWIQLVARYLLFCAAWTATLTAEVEAGAAAMPAEPAAPPVEEESVAQPAALSPLAVAAALVGVGVAAGLALGAAAVTRTRRRRSGTAAG